MKYRVLIQNGSINCGYLPRDNGNDAGNALFGLFEVFDNPHDAVKAAAAWLSAKRRQSLSGIIPDYVLTVEDLNGYELAAVDCPLQRGRCNIRIILRDGFPEDEEAML